jgi:hypothetical protein
MALDLRVGIPYSTYEMKVPTAEKINEYFEWTYKDWDLGEQVMTGWWLSYPELLPLYNFSPFGSEPQNARVLISVAPMRNRCSQAYIEVEKMFEDREGMFSYRNKQLLANVCLTIKG